MIRLLFVLSIAALAIGLLLAHVPLAGWLIIFGLLAVVLLVAHKAPGGRSPGTR